ncbi:MATE family efflux transporter [Roseateles sp.]|uniref:MATE family efflux transporter n=1 Tax=Roseateles sp. TaxID=1971397 RepID=UPI003BA4E2EA
MSQPKPAGSTRIDSLRRIAPLAWPVLIGQLAVLGFSTVDTLLIARYSAIDLAALAVGSAIYVTVFVGLMGVVMAISPIVGRLFGAGQLKQAGDQFRQSLWLCLGLLLIGDLILLFPQPFLAISQTSPEVEAKVRAYLWALAFSLPATLFFTAFRGFTVAVSRPKAVMILQISGLAVKVPLSMVFIQGFSLGPWTMPPMGAPGCGIATAIAMWSQALIAFALLRKDSFYRPFGLDGGLWRRPHWPSIKALLKLGIPMGGSILIEVTGFTFMAIFIARLGSTAVAGHQLAANLIALMFMLPLALANATGTLVAQSVGAHDAAGARRLGWHGLEIGVCLSFLVGALIFLGREQVLGLYTHDPLIIAAAMPLLLWVWLFHVADAGQTLAAFVLRAHHIATAPMVIYALAIWGVGLGGGYWVAFGHAPETLANLQGARGFWAAATAGLVISALGLSALLAWVHRQEENETLAGS